MPPFGLLKFAKWRKLAPNTPHGPASVVVQCPAFPAVMRPHGVRVGQTHFQGACTFSDCALPSGVLYCAKWLASAIAGSRSAGPILLQCLPMRYVMRKNDTMEAAQFGHMEAAQFGQMEATQPGQMALLIYELLGGQSTLSFPQPSTVQTYAEQIRQGLPASSLDAFIGRCNISSSDVRETVGISPRTHTRRKRERQLLSAVESDRLYRLVQTVARAAVVLGSQEKGIRWIEKPNRALGGQRPFDLLDTEPGEEQVNTLLERIEYGVFS